MDEKHRADCVERGIRLYWRAIGSMRDMALHSGDIEYVMGSPRGNGPERAFNVRLSAETAGQRVSEIAADVRAGKLPNGILLTRESTPDGIANLFAEAGFDIDTSGVCMALELTGLKPADHDATHVGVAAVESPDQLKRWADIVSIGLFGEPIMTDDQFWDLHDLDFARMYYGTWDGTPAAAAMTLADGDTATVELVATLPEYRRRGLAGAVLTEALRRLAGAGVRTVTLRAEPDAISLYHRLGFQDVYPRIVASLPPRG